MENNTYQYSDLRGISMLQANEIRYWQINMLKDEASYNRYPTPEQIHQKTQEAISNGKIRMEYGK